MALDYGEQATRLFNINFLLRQGSGELSALCPFHKESNPSFSLNPMTGLWKCFHPACEGNKGGNFEQLGRLLKGPTWEFECPLVPLAEVEGFHAVLKKTPLVLAWLQQSRGLTTASIDRFKLGWDGDRLTIPIFRGEKCINLRRHRIKKTGTGPKTISYAPGYGSLALFPEINLSSPTILLCEGELDTILACQLGFEALTCTGGAGSWKSAWSSFFKEKRVNVLYDIDRAGREGALRICRELHGIVAESRDVLLPLVNPPNADLTDYVVTYGHSAEDLQELINQTAPYSPTEAKPEGARAAALSTDLAQSGKAGFVGKLVKMRVMTAGKDLAPYACPKDIEFTCVGGLRICKLCSIHNAGGRLDYKIPPLSMEVLRLIDCTEDQQRGFIRKSAGIYPGCPRFEMKAKTYHTVEDVRLIPEMSYSADGSGEYVVRPAYAVGESMRPNSSYEVEGLVVPNPKTQYVTYLMDKITQVKDNVEGFEMTDATREQLKAFQPAAGQSVAAKMADIAHDLSSHVTHIFQRDQLITAVDLVYHSALSFQFQGRPIKKGWTELLVIGDTRCGKTETVTQLIQHYKAGEFATGENCSFAGLIGGMQQLGNRWSITWGKMPLNDKRLLAIDEVSGMPVEDVGRMSGVRSSGIAEITKVQSEKTLSRTRLIWIGNPRSPRPLATYDAGVMAIKELIGRPEDIARFDLAVAVASGEVPLDVINQSLNGEAHAAPHYTSELCHNLVMWAWSRRPDQVSLSPEAEKLCLDLAGSMSGRYASTIPLIEPAEQRVKLARLAVACAIRLYSTEDGEHVVVKPEHVQFVHDFMEAAYTSPAMGYAAYSRLKLAEVQLKDEKLVLEAMAPYGLNLVEGFLERQFIRFADLEDLLNMERKEVKPLVATLIQQRALKHASGAYVKAPAFIALLRRLQSEALAGVKVGPEGTEI